MDREERRKLSILHKENEFSVNDEFLIVVSAGTVLCVFHESKVAKYTVVTKKQEMGIFVLTIVSRAPIV